MAINMKARKHLSKGVMRVMRTSPFYTTIILKHQMVEDASVNGMEINGTEIRYNPEAIMTQTPAELGEYLKHMAMHIAFKHHVRATEMKARSERMLKDHNFNFEQVFDQAADLGINSLLFRENRKVWSSDAFTDAPRPGTGKFVDFEDGESAEKYFPQVVKLMEEEEGDGEGEGDGDGDGEGEGDGEGKGEGGNDANNQSPSKGGGGGREENEQEQPMNFGMVKAAPDKTAEQAEDEADEMIAQATMAAKEAGEGAGSVNEIIANNEKEVKVDWRAEVGQFFSRNCKGKKNYRHLNRRRFGSKIVFPTRKDKSPKRMILLVDVSGSMDDESVGAAYNHIEEIIKAKSKLVVELVPFDDGVFEDSIVEFSRENLPIKTETRSRIGWGGTRFIPAAEWAERRAREEDVSGVIMLTDRLPCDRDEFDKYSKATAPWLILSVLEHQFGKSHANYASNPKWCKILEISP